MSSDLKIGIALSGGGVRGVAHLGVLKALNEYGIFPNRFSGSSAGAIAAALYCSGHTPEEILEIILKTNYFKFLKPAISWTGILKMDLVEDLYHKYLKSNSFESLNIPLSIAELIKPLMASSCIPGMFDPIMIDNHYYIDGGVLNNLPVEPLDGVCDVVIGVNCNHLPVEHNIKNIKSLIERSIIMTMNYNVYSRRHVCDFFIEPQGLARYGVFDTKKAKDIFQAGYETAIKFVEDNPGMLELKSKTRKTKVK